MSNNTLWYDKPATDWLNGLPIGTGRLAGMVLGTLKRERLALNHEWLWRGVNRQRDNEPRAVALKMFGPYWQIQAETFTRFPPAAAEKLAKNGLVLVAKAVAYYTARHAND
jgi:hypothetical protein